ncbi:MAG: hypothetical protein F2772_15840, partial [Actinobacteria bacterium]|nr:hypothetical protein [Actinomycetota bacterium]
MGSVNKSVGLGDTTASVESSARPTNRKRRRNRIRWSIAGVVALAVAAVGVIAVTGGSNGRAGTLLTINGVQYDFVPGMSLAYANLTGANLSGLDLHGADFGRANLTSANLSNANLSGSQMNYTTVTGTNFTGANLTMVHSWQLIGAPLALPANCFIQSPVTSPPATGGFLFGCGAWVQDRLTGFNLSGRNLTGMSLENSWLNGVNFTNANLTNVVFRGTRMDGANLAGANLTGANLTNVN